MFPELPMLTKHILGYLPSLLVPALTAFAAIFCYTRLLTPEQYGHYALAINAMTLLTAVFFNWLQISISRLMPQAVREGAPDQLRVTVYVTFIAISLLLTATCFLGVDRMLQGDFKAVVWPSLLLVFARAFLNINQAIHRSRLDIFRYNLIECGQAVIGIVCGLTLAWGFGLGAWGAIVGTLLGMMCMALMDARRWLTAPYREFGAATLKEILLFGWPLMLSFGLSSIVSNSDRFLIEYYWGAEQVGIYAAGYTLMDRIIAIIFVMISTPSFPITVHKFEQEGFEAAREQTYRNGVAALMLALPACAGLMLTNRQLAHAFIGPAFRDGALAVMPWIALSGLMNGLASHYFSHAFHLGKKTHLIIVITAPTALFNLTLNIFLIPRYGYIGAAWAALGSYALFLALSIIIGRRAFPIKFPFKPALQIALAVALMAMVLSVLPFPLSFAGLIAMVAVGGITYAGGIYLFDVSDSRARLKGIMRHVLRRQ